MCVLKILSPLFYRPFFHNVSLWEKVCLGCSAPHDEVDTQFGHFRIWLLSLVLVVSLQPGVSGFVQSWCFNPWASLLEQDFWIAVCKASLFV